MNDGKTIPAGGADPIVPGAPGAGDVSASATPPAAVDAPEAVAEAVAAPETPYAPETDKQAEAEQAAPAPGDGKRITSITFIKGGRAKDKEQEPPGNAAPADGKAPEKKGRGKASKPGKGENAPEEMPEAKSTALDEVDKQAALEKEQAALKAMLDEKSRAFEKPQPRAAKSKGTKEKAPAKAKTPRPPKKETTPAKEEAPPAPTEPDLPKGAPRRGGAEQVVYLKLCDLHPFKNHPFGVRDDAEMKTLVESVKTGGVNQPALVRPIEGGGYEIIAGHRRQKASELAGYFEMPCIVREMTDDEAVLAMTDDNLNQRSTILPSEKAASIKMQFEAIKHQGARDTSGQNVPKGEADKRSIEIVGQRNSVDGKPMNGKMVQRYMRLTHLVPDLKKAIDEGRLGFTSAVEISFIKPKNQNFIAVALESEQVKPSTEQAQRMKDLDKQGMLNSDVIDGILGEEKKEELKVTISGKELETYFGKDKTPQQMKEKIIALLEEHVGKALERPEPEKKNALDR